MWGDVFNPSSDFNDQIATVPCNVQVILCTLNKTLQTYNMIDCFIAVKRWPYLSVTWELSKICWQCLEFGLSSPVYKAYDKRGV